MLGMCRGMQDSTHFFVNLFVSCTVIVPMLVRHCESKITHLYDTYIISFVWGSGGGYSALNYNVSKFTVNTLSFAEGSCS